MIGGRGVTVVVPAWRSAHTLPRVLEALESQARGRADVIVIDSSADGSAEALAARLPWVTVLELPERALPGTARNIGVASTTSAVVVFLDADAVPEPGWLDALLAPFADGADVVAGVVANGTPGSLIGTAGWLLEFSELLPGRLGPVEHAATCNLAIERRCLERVGPFPEDVFPGEDTIMTMRLAAGRGLPIAAGAVVSHLNRTSLRDFLAHQYRLGAAFAEVCSASPIAHRRFAQPALAPLGWIVRIGGLGRRLVAQPQYLRAALRTSPLLAIGLAVWTAGFCSAVWRAK